MLVSMSTFAALIMRPALVNCSLMLLMATTLVSWFAPMGTKLAS